MKVDIKNIKKEEIVAKYEQLKSSYKVADFFNTSATSVKRILKQECALRTQSEASKEKNLDHLRKPVSVKTRKKQSQNAKQRVGNKNNFYGKSHSLETKLKISKAAKERTGKRNPNYKHGTYKRRPKDYLITEFKPVRELVFKIDNFTCQFCAKKGGNLHAHHKIPYWVNKDAYLDVDNLMTCCDVCHLKEAHNGDYAKFNVSLISDNLVDKYNLDRERLNELANFNNKKV